LNDAIENRAKTEKKLRNVQAEASSSHWIFSFNLKDIVGLFEP
jgi:hypothetical protein